MLQSVSDAFWSEAVWLPPNTTWADVTPGPGKTVAYTDYRHLILTIPIALVLVAVCQVLNKYVFAPFGKSLGIRETNTKALPIPRLEIAYKARRDLKEVHALSKQVDMSERQVQRWWRQRRQQDKPSKLAKFCESMWRATFLLYNFIFALLILWDKDWLWQVQRCFTGYPHQGISDDVWYFYMVALGFYWSQTLTLCLGKSRKDFWQQGVHHAATLSLMCFSWVGNLHRIGSLVMLSHDGPEILLEVTKATKYAGYHRISDCMFTIFAGLWIVTRLGMYSYFIVWSAIIYAPTFPMCNVLIFLLCLLLALNVYWTWLIIQIASIAIKHGQNQKCSKRSPPIPPLDWNALGTEGSYERCSPQTAMLTQLGFYLLISLGYLNQLLFPPKVTSEKNRRGYAPLYSPFDQFFSSYVYRRVKHCFNQPVSSAPDVEFTVMERTSDDYNWNMRFTGRELKYINLGSYNYVGYRGGKDEVETAMRRYGIALSSPCAELGSCSLHQLLETELADFLGVQAALVIGNGFLTNFMTLPGLVGAGSLVLSDAGNHTSLVLGLRVARVAIRVFRHNDMQHLEQLARQARAEGRWKKIVIVLEGIHSMDGSLAALPAAVALKKQLGLHLYIDEAHSIGLGPRGRGATDACGVSPKDIDVLMGSFSKSFPGTGGYIAGSTSMVRRVRAHGHAQAYAQSMPPLVAAQVLSALRDLRAPSGQARVAALKNNTVYFRDRLRKMGVVMYGHPLSPVVPMMVYTASKMAACVERLAAAGIAVVGVGFPATPLFQARIRFCLSAAHTREHLDTALVAIETVADELGLRYSRDNQCSGNVTLSK